MGSVFLGEGSCRGRLAFPVEGTFEVEGDVGEADFGFGPLDADGADEQAHSVLLRGKDMLHSRSDFGTRGIGTLTLCG